MMGQFRIRNRGARIQKLRFRLWSIMASYILDSDYWILDSFFTPPEPALTCYLSALFPVALTIPATNLTEVWLNL
jgi:hypothetical protein